MTERAHRPGVLTLALIKLQDYAAFAKLRLASLVVFSAGLSYLLAVRGLPIDWVKVLCLVVGGFLVTGASNGFNQVVERDLDKLMKRTKNRPIPAGKMSVLEGLIVATVMGVVGISILWLFLNPLSGTLGALALFLYAAVYTPLKRITPWAVFVGAFPGAIPPMLGYIAHTGDFGVIPGALFAVQFIWQFPHFWAIAWKASDDYAKAGFHLLPSPGGKDKSTTFQILIYSIFLIPISLAPFALQIGDWISATIITLTGLWFLSKAVRLFNTLSDKDATALMFASFLYLPIVQIAFLIDFF